MYITIIIILLLLLLLLLLFIIYEILNGKKYHFMSWSVILNTSAFTCVCAICVIAEKSKEGCDAFLRSPHDTDARMSLIATFLSPANRNNSAMQHRFLLCIRLRTKDRPTYFLTARSFSPWFPRSDLVYQLAPSSCSLMNGFKAGLASVYLSEKPLSLHIAEFRLFCNSVIKKHCYATSYRYNVCLFIFRTYFTYVILA